MHFLLTLLAAIGLWWTQVATPFARREKLTLHSAVPNRAAVPLYGKFELTLDLAATYANPFDPNEIHVTADFTSLACSRPLSEQYR